MILNGNQRSGAKDLARHLMKEENDHVLVHDLRGFVSDDLEGAFLESQAIAKGTRCKQHLFSLSLNPPENEVVATADFEAAIDKVEDRLGLQDQPRAIVFHEKNGRRHAHVVWSRIDTAEMKAVQLSHSHRKLTDLSRELFREHGWEMPRGLIDREGRDPKNFTLAEWQQAQRAGKDPRETKAMIQDAWAISDNAASLNQALKARGFVLAKGDRRAAVVVDRDCEVYSLSKYAGVKAKDVRARLGSPEKLPSVTDAKAQIAREMTPAMQRLEAERRKQLEASKAEFRKERDALVERQKAERAALEQKQAERRAYETTMRQARYRMGLLGLWDRVRGETGRIKRENQREAWLGHKRDVTERDTLVFRHLEERRALERKREKLHAKNRDLKRSIQDRTREFEGLSREERRERVKEMLRERREAKRPELKPKGPTLSL